MRIYVVIDTKVIISAFITKYLNAATAIIMQKVINGEITPLYNYEILSEYKEVLNRKKFSFSSSLI